jgi:hypothetical protein
MICVVLVEAGYATEHWGWRLTEDLRYCFDDSDDDWDDRSPGGCTHGILPDVPAKLDPRPLATALAPALAGHPADGSAPTPIGATRTTAPKAVIWVDGGDEIVAHLDSLTVKVLDSAVVMSLDLEDDTTGRAPVVVRFAVSSANDDAGLIAATDEVAGGNAAFAARWGRAVQNAAWTALLGLAQEHATAHGQAPRGISAVAGAVRLHIEAPVDLTGASTTRGTTRGMTAGAKAAP